MVCLPIPNLNRRWLQEAETTGFLRMKKKKKKRERLTWILKEVDRAIDNLVKSGKLWAAPRRDSMPLMMGRPPYPDYGMLNSVRLMALSIF